MSARSLTPEGCLTPSKLAALAGISSLKSLTVTCWGSCTRIASSEYSAKLIEALCKENVFSHLRTLHLDLYVTDVCRLSVLTFLTSLSLTLGGRRGPRLGSLAGFDGPPEAADGFLRRSAWRRR